MINTHIFGKISFRMGVRFADSISFSLNIPWKWNNLVSLRLNYFIFIGYLKTGEGDGGSSEPLESALDPPLNRTRRKLYWLPIVFS